ncbi:beta-lactamase-like protein [Pseudomassariella vexata]|uniref:Beta-lactamase-like protein n=1 Tax=Pseudomassariella vexata TaxID=1141098 RepID=A0A1Y2DSL6_9PEZI|nr:beta-lactamase-like protein [Pseudomassariella vexata]ORY62126.1 beta-lactamase-like protein [Pseudomassariella vexata]
MAEAREGGPLATFQILNPYPDIYAYYDGRTGERFHSDRPNWLDDGAFALGVATYSIISGTEALIYDAHITTTHAAAMQRHIQGLGVTKTTILYSHFHADHIAGAPALRNTNSTFICQRITASKLDETKDELAEDDPPIPDVVIPTTLYSDQLDLKIGDLTVELHNFNIHTRDGTVLWLPSQRLLFAGDTLEDTATYISEAENLPTHLNELRRMADQFPESKILPAHGSPERIAAGGYGTSLIQATIRYIEVMTEPIERPKAWEQMLEKVVEEDVERGDLIYFEEYERVHRDNMEVIREARREAAQV